MASQSFDGGAITVEMLKRKILRPSLLDMSNIPDDFAGGMEALTRHCHEQSLNYQLRKIFKVIDKVTDQKDKVQTYKSLYRALHWATVAGMNTPSPFEKVRQDEAIQAQRAKRKANEDASERRKKVRPFVEDFLRDHESRRIGIILKNLWTLPAFKAVIPKGVKERQIKGDIRAVLFAIDARAQADEAHEERDFEEF